MNILTHIQLYLLAGIVCLLDILFSLWYVKNYKPEAGNEKWKIPVFVVVVVIDLILVYLTADNWIFMLFIFVIGCAHMAIKNMTLGKIWHNDWLYFGKNGFDAKILKYTQNPKLTYVTLFLIGLFFSGVLRYDENPKKK